MIQVEVAFATPERQKILAIEVAEGTSILEAARGSGIDALFPEIDWNTAKIGVWSKVEKSPEQRLCYDGDRIEIYRPLMIDPKEARRNRAAKS